MTKIVLMLLVTASFGLTACNNKSSTTKSNTPSLKEKTEETTASNFQSTDVPGFPPIIQFAEPVETESEDAEVESNGEPLYIAPQCPTISDNFTKALNDLKKYKDEILNAAGCETLASATAQLEEVVTDKRKVYEGVVKSYKSGEMLKGKDATALEGYATEVSEAAITVFELMEVTDCSVVRKKKKQIVRSLLGITFDAVGGLSSYLGPYGAPLSIGITAIKGVVNGIFNFADKQSGFKFSVSEEGRDQAIEYTKKLCVFYNFKNEAEVLLNASDRRESYLNLLAHLNRKIDNLTSPGICEGCDELQDLVTSYEDLNSEAEELVAKINGETKLNLGSHMLDALQTRAWVKDQMEKLDIEEDSFENGIGPAILGAELENLENFLIYRESTDFMSWINDEASSAFKDFSKDASDWAAKAYVDLDRAATKKSGTVFNRDHNIPYPTITLRKNIPNSITLYDFKELLLAEDVLLSSSSIYNDDDLVKANYNKSIKVLKNVNRFISSHNEYCNFFKLTGYYDAIFGDCKNQKIDSLNEAFLYQMLADPSQMGYLQKDKEDREKGSKMSNSLEEWNKHLDRLFGKWNKIHNRRIQNIISK